MSRTQNNIFGAIGHGAQERMKRIIHLAYTVRRVITRPKSIPNFFVILSATRYSVFSINGSTSGACILDQFQIDLDLKVGLMLIKVQMETKTLTCRTKIHLRCMSVSPSSLLAWCVIINNLVSWHLYIWHFISNLPTNAYAQCFIFFCLFCMDIWGIVRLSDTSWQGVYLCTTTHSSL